MTKRLASTIKPRRLTSDLPKENKPRKFDLSSTVFRKSATKCAELGQSVASREQRALFLKMTRMWEQLAQSWDKKRLVREAVLRRNYLRGRPKLKCDSAPRLKKSE